jgi:hypothetical protein
VQRYLRTLATPGGPAVRVLLPAGACRMLWAVHSSGVTGVTLTQLQDGSGVAAGNVPQVFNAAGGDLGRLTTTGIPIADDRAQLLVQMQGGVGSVCDLIVEDGCGCGR